jgi:hypothetical protein
MASPELIVLGKLAGLPPVMPGERHARPFGLHRVPRKQAGHMTAPDQSHHIR